MTQKNDPGASYWENMTEEEKQAWNDLEELWTKDSAERFWRKAAGTLKPEDVTTIILEFNDDTRKEVN